MRLSTRYRCVLVALFLIGPVFAAKLASAVTIEGRSSTQFIWYNDIIDGSKQYDLSQYLLASVNNIDGNEKFSVKGYGKLDYDLKNGYLNSRLYYLYADYKGFLNAADVKLGRQFINLSAGSALVDGIEADVNRIGPVGFVVTGGRDVIFGEETELSSHLYVAGAQAYYMGPRMAYIDLSYLRTYDDSAIARDIIASSYKQYFFDLLKGYASVRYDLTAETFNEVLVGLKYFPTLNLMLTGEYYQSYPTFDSTSIYSVFAVDRFNEYIARMDYTLAAWVDISLAGSHEDFGEGGHAQLYEVGLRFRPTINTTIGVFHDKRWGYPGDLSGYKIYGDYGAIGKWKVSGGIDYDVYERDDMTGQQTAKKYWAAGRYFFSKKISGSVRVEDNVNVNYSKDLQGRATFDVDF